VSKRLDSGGARSNRSGLVQAVSGVVGYALAVCSDQDPVRAVHEHRKAIRRARAVLALAQRIAGAQAVEPLVQALRDALQATSRLRDKAVLRGSLRLLRRVPGLKDACRSVEPLLASPLRSARSVRSVRAALARASALVTDLPARFDSVLPARIPLEQLEAALARSYRRARRGRRDTERTGAHEDLHRWRRRVKELRYQLELLDSAGIPAARRAERELDALAEELGAVTDLAVLGAFLDTCAPRARARAARLRAGVDRLSARRTRRALAGSERFFAPGAAAFAARLIGSGHVYQ